MAHDIFISHSSKDKPIADGICANLEAAGLRCWIAPRDIVPGEDWPTAITTAITKSRVMVLVFSANSNTSDDVGREIILAAKQKLIIIPFKIDDSEPEPGKQYYLARTHWLEAMNPPTQEQIQALVQIISSVLQVQEMGGVVRPVPSVPHPTAQSIQPKSILKTDPSRWRWVWLAGVLALILLVIGLWPKVQGMLARPTAIPTSTTTITIQPSSTVTLPPTITPTAAPVVGSTWTRPADGMVMSFVPVGEFSMGSETGDSDEQPVHTVSLDAFWIDQTEVTNRMLISFINLNLDKIEVSGDTVHLNGEKLFRFSCTMCGEQWIDRITLDNLRLSIIPGYEDHPASLMNSFTAQSYCAWAGARLPSEAEWEKAARGGLEGREYPWGDDEPICSPGAKNGAQFDSCSGTTAVVGSFKPNGYGIYDMAGNVWEVVNDLYDESYYSRSIKINPPGPTSASAKRLQHSYGELHVIRGGAWDYDKNSLRNANRFDDVPLSGVHYFSQIGFRCARDNSP